MLMRFLPSRSEHAPQGGGDVVACETSGHHHSHTLSQRIAWRGKRIDVNLSLSLNPSRPSLSCFRIPFPSSFTCALAHCLYVYII